MYSTGSGVLIRTFKVGFSPFDQKFACYITGWTDASGHDGYVNPAGLHKVGGVRVLLWPFTGSPVQKLSAYAERKKKRAKQPVISSLWYLYLFKKKKNLPSHYGHKCIPTPLRTRWGGHTSQRCLSALNCAHTQLTPLMGFLQKQQLYSSVIRYRVEPRSSCLADIRKEKKVKGKKIFSTTTGTLG